MTTAAKLRKAIEAAPKTYGWMNQLAKRHKVSRQRVRQIWNKLRGLCATCGKPALPGRPSCDICGGKQKQRNRKRFGYQGREDVGRPSVYS